MKVFSKRNALVGFMTLKALERRRNRRKLGARKLAAYLVLGLVSAGVLAALAAVVVRRQREAQGAGQHLEGFAVADEVGAEDAEITEPAQLDAEPSEIEPGFAA